MNNLLSNCGLVVRRISASEKDLPVKKNHSLDVKNVDHSTLRKKPSIFLFLGSSVCQKSCNGVILLIMIESLLREAGLISRMI